MRRILIGASVLLVATSSLVAAPKKKKPSTTKKDQDQDKAKGSASTDTGPEIEMDGGGEGSASTGGGTGGGSGSAATAKLATPTPPVDAPVPGPTVVLGARSLAVNDRPLTQGKGQLDVHGALPFGAVPTVDNAGVKTSAFIAGFGIGATYGVDDKIELGGDYAIGLDPGDIKGPLTLHGAFTVKAAPKFDIAVGGAFMVQPVTTTDTMGVTATTTYAALAFGAWFRYRVAPKVSLFTGLPSTPHPDLSLAYLGIPFPPAPYQLVLGLNNRGRITFGLPIGVGLQAAPKIYAFAALDLVNFGLSHTNNSFLFRDFIPLTLGGFYSLPKFDVGATFSDDFKQPGDYLTLTIVARYFIK